MRACLALARRAPGWMVAGALCLLLAACGGGGGGGGAGSGSSAPRAIGLPASAASASDANVALVSVEAGPGGNVNIPYVTVTVCVPGTSNCSTVDHVLLDTGSTGLRLFASKVGVALPAQTVGASSTISECAQFLSSVAWGTVQLADVQIGGQKTATPVPVQLVDAGFAPIPQDACGSAPLLSTATSRSANTQRLDANGILGVGLFSYDGQTYFDCASPSSSCTVTPLHAEQVQNPVALFATHNNGVVVQLPALPAGGATSAAGYLIFGIETAANNRLGAANVVAMNSSGVYFTTFYGGRRYDTSFFDTGSNAIFFDDLSLPICSGSLSDFYCPASTLALSASVVLTSRLASVNFGVTNALTQFSDPVLGTAYAIGNLGGHFYDPASPSMGPVFDWGLPFFFGRSIYTAIEGRTVGSGATALTGPFNAYTD